MWTYTSWNSSNDFCGVKTFNKLMIWKRERRRYSERWELMLVMTPMMLQKSLKKYKERKEKKLSFPTNLRGHLHFCDWRISWAPTPGTPSWHGSGSGRVCSASWWPHFCPGQHRSLHCRRKPNSVNHSPSVWPTLLFKKKWPLFTDLLQRWAKLIQYRQTQPSHFIEQELNAVLIQLLLLMATAKIIYTN